MADLSSLPDSLLLQADYGTATTVTPSQIRYALDAHDHGDFAQSSALVGLMLRDSDVQQAIRQRIQGFLGLPFSLEASDDSEQAEKERAFVASRWSSIAPSSVLYSIMTDVVFMGFGVGQLVWSWDESIKQLVPRLHHWRSAGVLHRPDSDTWWAQTVNGEIQITPGDGRWFFFGPESSSRPHLFGVVRCLGIWTRRADDAGGDLSRWSELHGQGTWFPRIPMSDVGTPKAKAFLSAFQGRGRGSVIQLPKGQTAETSYEVDFVEPKSDSYLGFSEILRQAGIRIRMAILGQDMTSRSGPDGGSYAQSKVGDEVRTDLKEFDAGIGAVLREQILELYALYRAGDRQLAPKPLWNASPPEDKRATADTIKATGDAIEIWNRQLAPAGKSIDAIALAERLKLPLTKAVSKPEMPAQADPAGAKNA